MRRRLSPLRKMPGLYPVNGTGFIYGVGCDLLPVEMFSYIADTPKGLHAAALETARFELEAVQL